VHQRLEFLFPAHEFAVEKNQRDSGPICKRTDHTVAYVGVEGNLHVGKATFLEQFARACAVRATLAGKHDDLVGRLGLRVDRPQHRVGIGNGVRIAIGVGLDEELFHATLGHQHRIPDRALAEAMVVLIDEQAKGFGELTVAVGEERDVRRALIPRPGFHDIGIVHRRADNFVDAARKECRRHFVKARQMLR
jgi:hypothetical protein